MKGEVVFLWESKRLLRDRVVNVNFVGDTDDGDFRAVFAKLL